MPPTYRIPEEAVAGVSFRLIYGPDNPNNALWHVRGLVDGRAVCRTWLKGKQRWHYDCLGPAFFHVNREIIEWKN